MPLVMCLGHWRELNTSVEIYRCRVCGNSVSLGNTGKAISLPNGIWEYEHYNKCAPVKPTKKARKKVTK